MTPFEEQLAALLAAPAFAAYGFTIVATGEGTVALRIPALATNMRPGGIVAGSVLVCAADVAVWLAIKTLLGIDDASVTVDLHTAFLAAAASDVVCEARIVRCGKRLVTGIATSRADGNDVALHTLTYARIAPRA